MNETKFSTLPTEAANPLSKNIHCVGTRKALQIINNEDANVASAVRAQIPSIENSVRLIVTCLKNGGRLFFIGAGTSGRLGMMEAAECPPTFNTPRSLVQAFMAGGRSSVFRSKEGAEDRGQDAARLVRKHVRTGDAVVGIAASGVTPFVRDGLKTARAKKARTVLLTCHSGNIENPAHVLIAIKTGPEVITGSTRLKAATATKMVLNMMTVATMIQLGKVHGNRMVDLQPRSAKLRARAARLISEIGRVPYARAKQLLKQAGDNTKVAIVMAKKKISRIQAVKEIKNARGLLSEILK